jgi:hypothetical protein
MSNMQKLDQTYKRTTRNQRVWRDCVPLQHYVMSEDFEQGIKPGAYEVMFSRVMVGAASRRAFLDTSRPLLGTALASDATTRRVAMVVVMNFMMKDNLVVSECRKMAL